MQLWKDYMRHFSFPIFSKTQIATMGISLSVYIISIWQHKFACTRQRLKIRNSGKLSILLVKPVGRSLIQHKWISKNVSNNKKKIVWMYFRQTLNCLWLEKIWFRQACSLPPISWSHFFIFISLKFFSHSNESENINVRTVNRTQLFPFMFSFLEEKVNVLRIRRITVWQSTTL